MEPESAEMEPTASADYSVFRRKARQASHQALYCLYTLERTDDEKTDDALLKYGQFELKQVQAMVWAVALPRGCDSLPEGSHESRSLKHWQASIRNALVGEDAPSGMTFEWARTLRRAFQDFLDMTIVSKRQAFEHLVISALKYLNKNLVTAFGVLAIAAVYWKVPVVNTLMSPEGWTGLIVALAAVLVAILAWRARASYGHRWLARVSKSTVTIGLVAGLAASIWLADRQLEFMVSFIAIGLALATHAAVTQPAKRRVARRTFRSFRYMALAPERGIARWQQDAGVLDLIYRRMLWRLVPVAVLAVVVWGLYLVDDYVDWGATLSVVSVLGLTGVLLLACYWIDFWDFLDPWPIRVIGVVSLGAFAGSAILTSHGRLVGFIILVVLGGLGLRYARDRTRRIVATVVFWGAAMVTALGALTLEQSVWSDKDKDPWERVTEDGWPYAAESSADEPVVVLAASGGGSRAAVYTAMTLEKLEKELPEIARNLQCISSVSGGSLASAAYVAQEYRDRVVPSGGRQNTSGLSALVNRDFIFPTLLGAITPRMTRGDAIERAWRNKVGIGTLSLDSLATGWTTHSGKYPPFPMPIFNSCTLDGHAVIISALDHSFYVPPPRERRRDYPLTEGNEETWVFDRDGIYGLGDLLKRHDPKLTAAVRASANFPFGFPLVTMKVDDPDWLYLTPAGVERGDQVQLTDGGVLSNSGLWTLYYLLMTKQEVLRERGLLLIIVEASHMPGYRDDSRTTLGLRGAIGDKNPTGQNLHWKMLQSLQNVYGDRLGVTQIDLIPTQDYNVLTTWALGSAAADTVRSSFEQRWEEEGPVLCKRWNRLVGEGRRELHCGDGEMATDKQMWPGTDRPPLN